MVYFHECTVAGNAEGFECEHFMTEKTAQLYFGSAYVKPENNESTWAKVASITKDSSIHGLMVERHTELSVESTMEIVGVDDYGTMKFTAAALAAALMAVIMMAATKAYDWSDAYESLSWSEKLCISGPMSLMVYAVSATLSSMTCESLGEVEDSGVYPSTFGDHTVVLGLFITACLAISLALTCFCDAERVAFFFFIVAGFSALCIVILTVPLELPSMHIMSFVFGIGGNCAWHQSDDSGLVRSSIVLAFAAGVAKRTFQLCHWGYLGYSWQLANT